MEIGAQEAVYLVLQMPLRRCTRQAIYVDTKRPEERTSLIKPLSELKELPANSKNIEMDNILKRYKRRPKSLGSLCYADFASWYELCKGTKCPTSSKQRTGEELPETVYEYNLDDHLESVDNDENGELPTEGSGLDDQLLEAQESEEENYIEDIDRNVKTKVIRFACGTQVRKRIHQKVIYSHITPINHDKEEHFRENIMLYTCWRNDEIDLLAGFESYEESFNAKVEEISRNKLNFENIDDYENLLEYVEEERLGSVIHPEAQHQESVDAEEGLSRSVTFGCFDPGVGASEQDYDLVEDLGINRRRVNDALPQMEMDNEQYLQSVRVLNREQKKFFYHILNKAKTQSLPFYTFLSGGAGCGKSVLIRAISQALLKHFNHMRNEDPSKVKLL